MKVDQAALEGRDLSGAVIKGADFSNASLRGVDFSQPIHFFGRRIIFLCKNEF